jgi:imidazolonepropionase-like amidohydrolase
MASRVESDLLIPGTGEPTRNGCVIFDGATISYAGPMENATANGPRTLGPQAPRSGQLRAGFVADILALREDPLKRIAVLTEPDNIVRVWTDGQFAVERPLKGPP